MFDWMLKEGATWHDFWTDPFWVWPISILGGTALFGIVLWARNKWTKFQEWLDRVLNLKI